MARSTIVFAALIALMVTVLALVSFPIYAGFEPKPQIAYGEGPFSTFPAFWFCGTPGQGNTTTLNSIPYGGAPIPANLNLTVIYSQMVNSPAFQAIAASKTWVTAQWIAEESGGGPEVHADFILISGGLPVSYPQVDYVLQTGEVVVDYNGPILCGPG